MAKQEIEIDPNASVESFDFSTMLADPSDYEVIRLETNDDCVIGGVTRLYFRQDMMFIFDEESKSVLCFNDDGTFNHRIGSRGRAANEYLDVWDVFVSDDTVFVYDNETYKILCYDFSGKFLRKIDVSGFPVNNILVKDNKIYLSNYWGNTEEDRYRFFVTDLNGELIKKELPFEPQDEGYSFSGNRYSLFADSLGVNIWDVIYRISGDEITPRYHIDFGNRALPRKYYPVDLKNLVSEGVHDKYILGVENMYESSRYLLFDFEYVDDSYVAVYDKRDDKIVISESLQNNSLLDMSPGRYFIENDNLYSYYPATDILFFDEYIWSQPPHAGTEDSDVMKAGIAGMTEDDNGVIIRHKLRTNEP
ncbi:MAG: 6-bladed beta-propeller [Lachnoclostridium sp.]|nr:6-bladed beta-propeller [Lachnoclostridium sp.]